MRMLFKLLIVLSLLFPLDLSAGGRFKLPVLPEPELYGNLLLDQGTTGSNMDPVHFSHWFHRQYFTCSVCHDEIGFALELNASGITEADNRAGRFCGTCHNGLTAFPVLDEKNCKRCHSGDVGFSTVAFADFSAKHFPVTRYGNRIDWVQALKEGLIKPSSSLRKQESPPMQFDKMLFLEAEWNFVPPAIFPHDLHLEWVNCNMCHPEIFNIKKKTTEHFIMEEILKGNFCGVCHLNVAFPMDDCQRCHPGMK